MKKETTPKTKSYQTYSTKYWVLKDSSFDDVDFSKEEKKLVPSSDLLFHVSKNDYLSTLATILRFFEEAISKEKNDPKMREIELKTISSVISDLLYVEKHYKLVSKGRKNKR